MRLWLRPSTIGVAVGVLVLAPVLNANVLKPLVEDHPTNRNTWWIANVGNLAAHVVLFALVVVLARRGALSAHEAGLDRPSVAQMRAAAAIGVMAVLGFVLREANIVHATQTAALGPTNTPERAAFFVCGAGIGALQEPLWRAFAFNVLKRAGLRDIAAIVVTAVSFGYFHGSVAQAIFTGTAAIGLSMLYRRTSSIWWPTLVHAGFNLALAPFA